MTKTRIVGFHLALCAIVGASGLASFGANAAAAQARSTAVQSSPSAQFQQSVQQQRTSSQLQQSQLQQQLHQDVSENARRPNASDTQAQRQADQADQARQDRDRQAQQDLIDRQRDADQLPRVVPNQPAASSDGHG